MFQCFLLTWLFVAGRGPARAAKRHPSSAKKNVVLRPSPDLVPGPVLAPGPAPDPAAVPAPAPARPARMAPLKKSAARVRTARPAVATKLAILTYYMHYFLRLTDYLLGSNSMKFLILWQNYSSKQLVTDILVQTVKIRCDPVSRQDECSKISFMN